MYNGDRVLEETNDSGTVQSRYTTASPSYFSPLLHMWRSTSTSRFPSYDLTGSARQLLDASGTVTDTYELDAFGRTVSSTGSTPNPYKYDAAWGYITDSSGFQQLGARFYWPEIGRFLQQDPAGEGMNWYAYAENSPVVGADPLGQSVWWETAKGMVSGDNWAAGISAGWNSGYYSGWAAGMLADQIPLPKKIEPYTPKGIVSTGLARGYYGLTDGRFKAWGKYSKKLVPQLAKGIGFWGGIYKDSLDNMAANAPSLMDYIRSGAGEVPPDEDCLKDD